MSEPAPPLFVVPAANGPPSGGNRYNDGLLESLAAQGVRYERVDPAALSAAHARRAHGAIWIDSLALALIPALRAWAPGAALGLIAHSLPSLLAEAAGYRAVELLQRERQLLLPLARALAPSGTMAELLGVRRPGLPVAVIPPALPRIAARARPSGALRALLVANLLPHKGVLPLLQELAAQRAPADRFELRIVGRLDAEPAYARACAELAALPALTPDVRLLGPLSFDALLEELAAAQLLVSASRIESFGMAVAEARAAGCAVLARAGGHVGQLVDADAGGELVADERQLAAAFLRLARDPSELARRVARAEQSCPRARSWADVAREFSALPRA